LTDHRDFDYQRFASAGIIGILFGGFVYPYAYARLDILLPGVTVRSVLAKSLVEIARVGIFVNSVSIPVLAVCSVAAKGKMWLATL
jgi:hypothetical protein